MTKRPPSDEGVDPESFRPHAIADLDFEEFSTDTAQVRDFDCGQPPLNDFLNTSEVADYQKASAGRTTLVFFRGELVGYYTLCPAELKSELVETHKSFSKSQELHLEAYPAWKIGRFAVQKKWHRKGVGRLMMRRVMGQIKAIARTAAIRLVILETKPDPNTIAFYESVGFEFVTATHGNKKRRNRTMFIDLHKVPD